MSRFCIRCPVVILACAAVFSWACIDVVRAHQPELKALTLPGRIQQQQQAPEPVEPLQPVDPIPQWSRQKPLPQSAIAQGAVVPLVLTAPVELERLRVNDQVEFETVENLLSGDGRWKIPKGSLVHAKVASWNWAQTGIKRVKIGVLFYEFVTPDGWVVPFEGSLLGLPKPRRQDPSRALLLAQGTIPTGGPGVIVFSKNPLILRRAEKNRLAMGEVFSLRVSRAVYYGAALAYQDKARKDRNNKLPDTGMIPVSYPHFSEDATQDIDQYQDNSLMPLP